MSERRCAPIMILSAVLLLAACCNAKADEPLALREEEAIRRAVQRVATSVVRIETVGGLERVGRVLVGTGPTTGLIVSADGYIVSSQFNFIQKPSSILVTLPDGTRLPATLVATDYSRMLVLLKVQPREPLAVPEAAPEREVRPGQWAIAVGRTYEGPLPNVSVGIVSALARIWGKALQTDAKISPNNYGGPLIDVHGRVLGVLVPLSPQGATAVAGMEWYDSGIGFAIPMEHVFRVLPKWKEGDLHPGVMGVSFKAGNPFADPATLATCRIKSPAHEAGLQAGDTIVEVEGRPVVRQAQVRELISPRYAGETIKLVVLRGEERLERELTLVDELQPYAHPFLGFLPLRDKATADRPLVVRYVYPDSPAAKAGLEAGDVVVSLGGQKITGRADAVEKLAALEPGDEVVLEIRRGEQPQKLTFKAGALPEAIPGELPPARAPGGQAHPVAGTLVGRFEQKVPEFDNAALVYVPEAYDPAVPHGIVLHLSADGSYDADALIAAYKPLCDAHDLILVAPQTVEPQDAAASRRWSPTNDVAYIGKLLELLGEAYSIDRARVAVHGYQGGATLGYVLAARNRDWIRAVAAVESLPLARLPENEPAYRLAFYLATSTQGRVASGREEAMEAVRKAKYPLTYQALDEQPRPLNQEELATLIRWIDTLDRL